ncbi:hypothetical protein EV360DRAFT_88827 [Lentinula raphanica]|nr:hypothetical protein EV360DRAFT_88827 [Lentinula raphanica]
MSFKFNNSAALIVVPSPSFVRLRLPSSTTRVVLPLVVVLSNQSFKFILHSLDSGVVQSPSSLAHQQLRSSDRSAFSVVVVLSNQDRSFSSPALVVPLSTITVLPLVAVLSNQCSFDRNPNSRHSPIAVVFCSSSAAFVYHHRSPFGCRPVRPKALVLFSNSSCHLFAGCSCSLSAAVIVPKLFFLWVHPLVVMSVCVYCIFVQPPPGIKHLNMH